MRERLILSLAVGLIVGAVGCGGGSGSGGAAGGAAGNSGGGGSITPTVSGTGTGSLASLGSSSGSPNVATVVVDSGPDPQAISAVNELYVSVTLCEPGSTTACQTIDHVEIDTASVGLRILSSAFSSSLSFAQEVANGNPLARCEEFADGYVWGPVVIADVHLAGETAASIPVHIIGDPDYTGAPSSCLDAGPGYNEGAVAALGANGILGIGVMLQDCGSACAQSAIAAEYYGCPPGGACTSTTASLVQQVSNPVASFSADNNGVIVELPQIAAGGEATVTGSLVFGIDTESDNESTGVTVLEADPQTAAITTYYNGGALTDSYFDTGSDAYYFNDSSIAVCGTYYCPASTLTLGATNESYDQSGATSNVTFSVANADQLAETGNAAFDDLGAPLTSGQPGAVFDWGLPFFFGRNVYIALEGANTSAGVGPFFAY